MPVPCPVPERDDPCKLNVCITDPPTPASDCPTGCELGPCSPDERAKLSFNLRCDTAKEELECYPIVSHPCNCDEIKFQETKEWYNQFPASFTKGLPHDPTTGLVKSDAYCTLLRALASSDPVRFNDVPLGCCPTVVTDDCPPCPDPDNPECRPRRRALENPQAAFAFDLEGADSHALCMPPAPAFSSSEEIAEIAELYWMALARDVPFTDYATDPLISDAASDLAGYKCFFGPTDPKWLFRDKIIGFDEGPYVSQFLYMDAPFGASFIPARIRTLLPRIDFLTAYDDWLAVQDGCDRDQPNCDPEPKFIRNGRDLGQYVHVDLTFNAFVHAAMILSSPREPLRRCEARAGRGFEFARCLPYVNPAAPFEEQFPGKSPNQIGFATFGAPHIFSLLLEAMNRGLKAVWYQKWAVHRRLRPEEFAHRVHSTLVGPLTFPLDPINFPQLQANVLPRVFNHNAVQNRNRRRTPSGGTYLLPQAFAEGSPIHPSYGAGHATASGAMATILKAFFSPDTLILNPVVPTPDGLGLVPFDPSGDTALSVEGEINKLAANISLGRNFAGVHWRSDHAESLRLGEQVAIRLLQDQRNTYNEPYVMHFRLFDGTPVTIRPGSGCPPEYGDDESRRCYRTRTPYVCATPYGLSPAAEEPAGSTEADASGVSAQG